MAEQHWCHHIVWNHSDGTVAGTIEYIHADGGAFNGNRIHFNLEILAIVVVPRARSCPSTAAPILTVVNMTFGTDLVASGQRDHLFLEVLAVNS